MTYTRTITVTTTTTTNLLLWHPSARAFCVIVIAWQSQLPSLSARSREYMCISARERCARGRFGAALESGSNSNSDSSAPAPWAGQQGAAGAARADALCAAALEINALLWAALDINRRPHSCRVAAAKSVRPSLPLPVRRRDSYRRLLVDCTRWTQSRRDTALRVRLRSQISQRTCTRSQRAITTSSLMNARM